MTMTLEAKNVLREGWLTLFKNRKTGLFNSKPAVRYYCNDNKIYSVGMITIICNPFWKEDSSNYQLYSEITYMYSVGACARNI